MTEDCPDDSISARVEHLISAVIGPVHQLVRPTPLAAALQIAAFRILQAHAQQPQQEEEITSMLLGAFINSIDWVAHCLESTHGPGLSWAQHSKYGSDVSSEGSTGADFSLKITFGENFARAGVFQAKLAACNNTVNIHRIAPYREDVNSDEPAMLPEPQALRLLVHAENIAESVAMSHIDWIHYCAYGPTSFFCIPLSQAEDIILDYKAMKLPADAALLKLLKLLNAIGKGSVAGPLKRRAEVLYRNRHRRPLVRNEATCELIHVLAVGASTPPGDDAPGWLNLCSADEIEKFRKTFSKDTEFIELDGNAHPSPNPSSNLIEHLNEQAHGYAMAATGEQPGGNTHRRRAPRP